MATTMSDASRRYRDLVEQLGDERGRKHGWKAEVADLLGVDASFITKTLGGKVKNIGAGTVMRAASALGLDTKFFSAPGDAPVLYRSFLSGSKPFGPLVQHPTQAALLDFAGLLRALWDEDAEVERQLPAMVLSSQIVALAEAALDPASSDERRSRAASNLHGAITVLISCAPKLLEIYKARDDAGLELYLHAALHVIAAVPPRKP